ncbi:MAG TPA: hypothetical protein VMY76_09325 [Gemmatimonadales bacterium]|nr:hypothetical protein [Gemmatimonadales bacterium]
MRDSAMRLLLPFALVSTACGSGDLTLPGPGDPASLRIVTGNEQQGRPGEPLNEPLVVQLLDALGTPVAGKGVTFRFTSDVPEAALDPGTAPTDDQGRASAWVTLGTLVGAQSIEALVAVDGEDLRVRFDQTAIAETGGEGGGGGGEVPEPPQPPGRGNPGVDDGGNGGGNGNGGGPGIDNGGGGGNQGGGVGGGGGGGSGAAGGGGEDGSGKDKGAGKDKGKGKDKDHGNDKGREKGGG